MHRSSVGRKLLKLNVLAATSAVAALLLSAACAPQVDTEAATKALTQLDGEWSKAAQAKDADRTASYYAEDVVIYAPNEPQSIGRDAAHKIWAAYFADTSFTISWTTVHAAVAKSGDFGFTAGTYDNSYRGPDGKLVNEKGKYLEVWQKQKDGSWKCVQDMWNKDAK
jgi:ketosteroid isomerase-like protein